MLPPIMRIEKLVEVLLHSWIIELSIILNYLLWNNYQYYLIWGPQTLIPSYAVVAGTSTLCVVTCSCRWW